MDQQNKGDVGEKDGAVASNEQALVRLFESSPEDLAREAYKTAKAEKDIKKVIEYWKQECILIQSPNSGSRKFFAEEFSTAFDEYDVVTWLAEELEIPGEVSQKHLDELGLKKHFGKGDEELRLLERLTADAERAKEIIAARNKEIAAQKRQEQKLAGLMARRSIQLFPVVDEIEVKKLSQSRMKDAQAAFNLAISFMAQHGGRRIMPELSKKLKDVAALKAEFENFSAAIDALEGDLLVSAHSKPEGFKVRPLLLNGAPGIGKTAFAMRLAEILGLPFHKFSGGGLQTPADICGGSKHWANTSNGRVFDLLARSEFGTAVVVIDEADKIQDSTDSYKQIIPTLLDLLEPESARIFEDQSMQVKFDASHLIVIMTSNDMRDMNTALLSRCRVIEIGEPTPQQRCAVGQKMFASLTRNLMSSAGRNTLKLDEEALMEVAESKMDLRKLNKVLSDALSVALRNRSGVVKPEVPEDEKERFSMGFIPR